MSKSTVPVNRMLETLREEGLRLTPQRIAVCEALANSKAHPTAEHIYAQLLPAYPALSLMTVYNTLNLLSELGIITMLGHAGDNASHYDADTSPHVNLACINCHTIIDLESEHPGKCGQEIGDASGYRVLGARVMYYGICPACQGSTRD